MEASRRPPPAYTLGMVTRTLAKLDHAERRAIKRFVEVLRQRLGDDLVSVWLFGSRARGEGNAGSDVDLLVVTRRGARDLPLVSKLALEVELSGEPGIDLAPHVWSPQRVEDRRRIRSFFMQEVDRDKIVLYGPP